MIINWIIVLVIVLYLITRAIYKKNKINKRKEMEVRMLAMAIRDMDDYECKLHMCQELEPVLRPVNVNVSPKKKAKKVKKVVKRKVSKHK
jgi:hypothetical protein